MADFVKRNDAAPSGFFACEAAGLTWLSAAPDGVPCARVVRFDDHSLTLERLTPAPATAHSAYRFGQRLAHTHAAGAEGFGAPPDGWGGPGFFGPVAQPIPVPLVPHDSWGVFYADDRLVPMLARASRGLSPETHELVERVIELCRAGVFDDADRPARLHGDLWSGNVMWTARGAVLIDPSAHGGHRETDLAMLALFGCPYLDEIFRGYQSVHPLRPSWRDRLGLRQIHPLLAHVALFGSGYEAQTARAAGAALALAESSLG